MSGKTGAERYRMRSQRRWRLPNGRSSRSRVTAASALLLGELATAARYRLPIKVVVMKNNTLGQIKWVFVASPDQTLTDAARSMGFRQLSSIQPEIAA